MQTEIITFVRGIQFVLIEEGGLSGLIRQCWYYLVDVPERWGVNKCGL